MTTATLLSTDADNRRRGWFPWRFLLGATLVLGLISGLRIYFLHGAFGIGTTLLDGLASGLMEWLPWLPLAPLTFWLATRFSAARLGLVRGVLLHIGAGTFVSFVQISVFALLSSLVRSYRFGADFRLDLSSPAMFSFVPGMAVYCILILGWWWRTERSAALDGEPTAALPTVEIPPAVPAGADWLQFQAGRGTLRLRAAEIDWVRSAGNYVELHVGDTVHLVRETLGRVHARLGVDRFVRIHRSTLARCDAVVEFRPSGPKPVAILRDGTRLVLGRKYRAAVERSQP